MVIQLDLGNLGTRICSGENTIPFEAGNDDNGHLNNTSYNALAEILRTGYIFRGFGWSDFSFNSKGYQYVRKLGVFDYKFGMDAREGKINCNWEIYAEPSLWIHLVVDFIRGDGKLAAKMYTNDFFNKKVNGIWRPQRQIPQFFIDRKEIGR